MLFFTIPWANLSKIMASIPSLCFFSSMATELKYVENPKRKRLRSYVLTGEGLVYSFELSKDQTYEDATTRVQRDGHRALSADVAGV